MKQNYYVVVLVIRSHDYGYQLLMGRRAAGSYMGGSWQLVSGGMEGEEKAWEAALRELWEETGLVPQEIYRLSTLTSFYRPDNDSLNTAPMFCAIVEEHSTVKINQEHSEFEWVDVEAAASRLMWPSDHQAFEEAKRVILGNGLAKQYMRIQLEVVGTLRNGSALQAGFALKAPFAPKDYRLPQKVG